MHLRKLSAKEISESYSTIDTIKAWIRTFGVLVSNLKDMLEPFLTRIILYLGFINEVEAEMRPLIRTVME